MNGVKKRIVLLGPPASGKGTQADRISAAYSIPHVSTGALLRSECEKDTPLGREADEWTSKGLLVPDDLVVRIVTRWMDEHGPSFIFDGFPRTVGQAVYLDVALQELNLPLDLIVLLELPESEIRRRVSDRLSCTKCGATFGATLHGLSLGDACPRCASPLVRRNDDNSEALDRRLEVYTNQTEPVVDYYEKNSPKLLSRINAVHGSDEVFGSLVRILGDA
ncbi:MAG: nucleoside monophosphate kinase [Verrucomicrobia bacterium]|nr:MAG: nucleoside monophosphate kinase [Verrucomicrobiota bacterium]